MDVSRRNISPGIFVLVIMVVLFSFFQRDKDKHNKTSQSVISYTNSIDLQAIIVPESSSPGTDLFWVKKTSTKFSCPDWHSCGEFILNELISSRYNLNHLEYYSYYPIVSLFLLQKVPEQGNEDDVLSII